MGMFSVKCYVSSLILASSECQLMQLWNLDWASLEAVYEFDGVVIAWLAYLGPDPVLKHITPGFCVHIFTVSPVVHKHVHQI